VLIAIEGIDGVGKTSVAKMLAADLGFEFVEKALKSAFGLSNNDYVEQREALKKYANNDSNVLAWFFGLTNLLCALGSNLNNVVADRYITTNFFWYGEPFNSTIYRSILEAGTTPFLTVVLDADNQTVRNRILNRNGSDAEKQKDLEKARLADAFVGKVEPFLKENNLDYIIIDTKENDVPSVVAIIKENLKKIEDEQRG